MAIQTTIPKRFKEAVKQFQDKPCYYYKSDQVEGNWVSVSWKEYYNQVRQTAKALIALGLQKGGVVNIIGKSRPEWSITDMGAMMAAGVPAGIYQTSAAPEIAYIINHSEALLVVVETKEHLEKVLKVKDQLKKLKYIVTMKGLNEEKQDEMILNWDEFLKKGNVVKDEELNQREESITKDELGTLIYTSGTTGKPKGVMLSHGNLTWTSEVAVSVTEATDKDCNVSFLPLSHIAEQMFTIHIPLYSGHQVYYGGGIKNVLQDLQQVQPTIVFSPPRLYEKFYAALSAKVPKGVPLNKLPGEVKLKMRKGVGLGKVKKCISGAAPIGKPVLEFFKAIGIIIYEVYGQSEDNGPTSFNLTDKVKLGSVGPPYPDVEVKISDEGEILVKGNNVFKGYYKDPEETKKTLVDGWLHSGDLGKFDDEGFLYITGRKKDIIITSGGKNITPINIENDIKLCPVVGNAVVVGDNQKYLTCIITLDPEVLAKVFGEGKPVNVEEYSKNPKIVAMVQKKIDEVNEKVARVEQIKKFKILPRPFEIEKGEITPTMKVKRSNVNKLFEKEIKELYQE